MTIGIKWFDLPRRAGLLDRGNIIDPQRRRESGILVFFVRNPILVDVFWFGGNLAYR
jgi:hypothetical protein